jgi:NitT/TauT family transport system ATP-binding protein
MGGQALFPSRLIISRKLSLTTSGTKPIDESSQRPPMMPASVRAGQVIGLVEVVGNFGSTVDASKLAEELGADLATLLPMLDAAEMLGLVRTEKGDVSLTEFGLKFQKTSKQKVRLLKDTLSKIEPFRTALELGTKEEHFSAHDVSEALLERDLRWHHKTEMNESLIQAMLVHWAIYSGLLNYNGKTGKFSRLDKH